MDASIKDNSNLRRSVFPPIAIVLAAALAGCLEKPIEPVAPSWDVSLTAPITRKSYNLGEIGERNPSLFAATPGTGDMVFRTSGSSTPVMLGGALSLRPLDLTGTAELGPISVAAFQQTVPVQFPGVSAGMPVPPIASLALPPIAIDLSGFQTATMEEGTLELRLLNNLPAAITLAGPVELRDDGGAVVCSFVFVPAGIPAGQTAVATAPLAGVTLTSGSSLTGVTVSTPGSASPVGSGDHLRATLIGTRMRVRRAVFAEIPPQTLAGDPVLFALTDSTRVARVTIGSGTLSLDASSGVAVPVTVRFRFEEILTPSGQQYVDSIVLAPRGSGSRSVSLSGMTIRSTDGSLLTDLRVAPTVVMATGSGGNPVTIASDDQFVYRLRTSAIGLDSLDGVLKPTSVAINDDVPLDWGDLHGRFTASMRLPSADLQFVPQAGTGMPLLMNLRLEAARPGGAGPAVLPFPVDALKTDGDPVVFDPGDVGAFLAQIVGQLPPALRLAGSITLNPDYDTARRVSLGRNTTVAGEINLNVPLTLSILGGAALDTLVLGDTTSDGSVDRWLDSGSLEALNSGQVTIEVENALPLAFALKFGLMDRSGLMLLDLPEAAMDSIRVEPATMISGRVVSPSFTQVIIDLGADDLMRINPAAYLRFSVNLLTPGQGLVVFRASDRLTVRSWGRFSYTVDP